jgi:hypothetical protein
MRRETGRNRTSMRLETVETVHVLGGDLWANYECVKWLISVGN